MELTLFIVQISSLICPESRLCGSMYQGWEEMTSHSALVTLEGETCHASIRHASLGAAPPPPVVEGGDV